VLADVISSWKPITDSLGQLSARFGNKPVVFTEVGYCANTGSNVDPAQCNRAYPWRLNRAVVPSALELLVLSSLRSSVPASVLPHALSPHIPIGHRA
jgi:hypothetical protein